MTNRRSEAPLALVTGISGVQGAAAARWLLAEGFRVRGWTALPDSDVTRSLHALGCDILTGPLDTPERAGAAMAGARAVVSWQEYDVLGVDREVDQGRSLAAAAAGAGVEMLVYISTANARLRTGLLRFDVKERIEEQVRASGVPYSILRPAFPMQELERYGEEIERRGGRLELPVGPEVPLELIDLDDVAAIASRAASDPESFAGREIDLASEERTMIEIAEAFGRALGRAVRYEAIPWSLFRERRGSEMTAVYRWLNNVGYEVVLNEVRRQFPGLRTLEEFLLEQHHRERLGAGAA